MQIWQDIKWQYRYGTTLIKLILINIAVFVIVNIVNLPFMLMAKTAPFDLAEFLALPAAFCNWLYHPTGFFTYMFVHVGFLHILFNMLGLYWFGQIVQDLIGKSKILPIYILGGLFGGFMYVIAYHIFPVFSDSLMTSTCIGASAAVMAIVLSAATISPDYELGIILIGPVKIKWIALAYVILDLINIQYGNAGGHIAHLGGALFGFIYIKSLQNGTDLARPFYAVSDFISNLFSKKPAIKVAYKKEYAYSSANKQNTSNTTNNTATKDQSKQERLDEILDKINRSSYDSLSKEEKEFLFKISQED